MSDELLADSPQQRMDVSGPGESYAGGRWLVCGIFALGMLVGLICGLSSAAVTLPLMAAVVSLTGGGIMSMLSGLKEGGARKAAGAMLCAFCSACLVFLLLGIWAREHSWMAADADPKNPVPPVVLKSNKASTLLLVTGMCANQDYDALASMVKEK